MIKDRTSSILLSQENIFPKNVLFHGHERGLSANN